MTRKRVIRPAAQTDIDQHADYLAEHGGEALAYRFLDAVDQTVARLLESPGVGAAWITENPHLQNIRRQRVAGFPNHLLFYRHDERAVEVLHLYHGRQDIEARLGGQADEAFDGDG